MVARGGGHLTLWQAHYTFTKAVAVVGGIEGCDCTTYAALVRPCPMMRARM
jgi:hypothetical protein